MAFLILFIFGLLVGSFLNVVTLRYAPGAAVLSFTRLGGRSHCPYCRKTLHWYELIPLLSYLIQGRKCRSCYAALSWQYPFIELLSGLITAALPLFFYQYFHIPFEIGMNNSLLWYYLFSGVWVLAGYTAIVLSVIDFRHTLLPDSANLFLGVLGIAALAIKSMFASHFPNSGSFLGSYASVLQFQEGIWVPGFTAALLAGIFFALIILLTRGKGMGLGDLKLVMPMGLLLGWPDVLFAVMASFVIGAFYSMGLLISGRKKFKQAIPFGPFLILGMFVVVFYGEAFMQWYFSLL